MVDFDGLYEVIKLRVRGGTGVEVVDLRARHVRRGHQGENLLGRATDPAGGDLIVGELLADVTTVAVGTGGVRIENRDYPCSSCLISLAICTFGLLKLSVMWCKLRVEKRDGLGVPLQQPQNEVRPERSFAEERNRLIGTVIPQQI